MSYEPENPTSDIGEDAQAWLAREFQEIQSEFLNPDIGRAGLALETSKSDSTILTQTPIKITGFDRQLLPEFRAESSIADSTIKIAQQGLWFLAVKLVARIVAHTANYSRGAVAELYNETKAQTYKVIDFSAVARYQDIIDYTISIPVYVPNEFLGDEFALYSYATTTNSITLTSLEVMEYEFILLDKIVST